MNTKTALINMSNGVVIGKFAHHFTAAAEREIAASIGHGSSYMRVGHFSFVTSVTGKIAASRSYTDKDCDEMTAGWIRCTKSFPDSPNDRIRQIGIVHQHLELCKYSEMKEEIYSDMRCELDCYVKHGNASVRLNAQRMLQTIDSENDK